MRQYLRIVQSTLEKPRNWVRGGRSSALGMVKLNLVERKPVAAPPRDKRPALGVIEALSAGLEGVLRHPWLLLIPLALDLFLWVGPRLEAPALYQQFEPTLRQMAVEMSSSTARLAVQDLSTLLQDFLAHYNLFSALSVSLVGVPVINAGVHVFPPGGAMPWSWLLSDFDAYLLAIVALSVAGLFLSALFWTLLSGYVRGERFVVASWLQASWRMWKPLLLLLLCLIAIVLMSIFPLLMVMFTFAAISPGLASLVPLLAMAMLSWLIFVSMFTPHGLALYRISLGQAIRISTLVVRYNFSPTVWLVVLALSISMGMGLIWDGIPFDSLWRVVAMAGSAVIGTGLVLASLLYYQNRSTLLYEQFHWPLPGETVHPTLHQ